MSKFIFQFSQVASHFVVIEADDITTRDAAESLAWDQLPGSLCHQDAEKYDMSGDWYLDSVEKDE